MNPVYIPTVFSPIEMKNNNEMTSNTSFARCFSSFFDSHFLEEGMIYSGVSGIFQKKETEVPNTPVLCTYVRTLLQC